MGRTAALTLSLILSLSTLATGVSAAPITDGFTFSVASLSPSLGGNTNTGDHLHSSTGGSFGNPAGIAEVGSFEDEEVRGLSEYNLAGLSPASSAWVTFDTYGFGLFPTYNDFPFDGTIDLIAYQGNNTEDVSDYQAPAVATIGSFSTVGLSVGTVLSFNILSIFNNAIANNWSSLGIRLSTEDTVTDGGAWSFNNFRLTSGSGSSPVPEPGVFLLLATCLLSLALGRRSFARS